MAYSSLMSTLRARVAAVPFHLQIFLIFARRSVLDFVSCPLGSSRNQGLHFLAGCGPLTLGEGRSYRMTWILVIDDEAASQAALTRLFTQSGYDVRTVTDGSEGLRRLAEGSSDVPVARMEGGAR